MRRHSESMTGSATGLSSRRRLWRRLISCGGGILGQPSHSAHVGDEVCEADFHGGARQSDGSDGAPRSITGHIDFLQVRNDAVHILDYKPDARTNKPIAQLAIYALALTIRVPGLKLFDIKCAWFNEEEYNEFFPRTLFAKRQER